MITTASTEEIKIFLKDKDKTFEVPKGTSAYEFLTSNKLLPGNVIALRVDDQLADLNTALDHDCTVSFVTYDDPEGKEICYHSTSHLMAQAVKQLFPEAKLAIGPPIDNGFYYDFEVDRPFTPEDLEKIEERMKELSKNRQQVERQVKSRDEAIADYKDKGEVYKVELLEDIDEPTVSFYTQGDFSDMCRGPHVPDTGFLKYFKLLNIAGAYWRGDENRPMLQRIYGTAAGSKKELKEYLKKLEEAKERDHRKIGKELDLFSIHEEAGAGLVFWHPHGGRLRTLIETFWKDVHYNRGYEQIYIPHILREDLFRQSGHLDNYNENMYSPMQIDGIDYYVKPMNCPGHILIYKTHLRSFRDLPIRYAELGTVYRYERSGVLHGLFRVRGFTQDDAHIFCRPDQLEEEIEGTIDLADFMMKAFGFEYQLFLSTRPEKSIGTDEAWEHAEATLRSALDKRGIPYDVEEGGGAFYGPKIDVNLLDALGRTWQGPTIQLDFNLPERFQVEYVDTDGERKPVVMIHRTVLGSMERFTGNLIEHYKGAFPAWLSPVQVKVLPITDELNEYAETIYKKLRKLNIRAEIDSRNEKIGYKIREAESLKIPLMVVVGKREAEENTVSLRERGRKDLGCKPWQEALNYIQETIAIPQDSDDV